MASPSDTPAVTGVTIAGTELDQGMLDAAFRAVREYADKSIYSRYFSDAECHSVANAVVTAIADYQSGKAI